MVWRDETGTTWVLAQEEEIRAFSYHGREEGGRPWIESTGNYFEATVPSSYTSGCGGPSYRWTDDWLIEIGGQVPQRAVPAGVIPWKDLIYSKAQKYNVPAHFVAGIMSLESGGKADAGSPAGAMGLMQLMRSTANMLAGRTLTPEEIYEPDTNVDLGTKLLSQLWGKYKGDPIKIAFSYNAGSPRCGSGCVRDYQDKPKMPCIADCSPNQFNLKGDCYANSKVTVDYGGIVSGYANAALLGDFPLESPAAPASEESEESSSWVPPTVFALGAASLGLVLFFGPGRALVR
jgi:hypothetical protein